MQGIEGRVAQRLAEVNALDLGADDWRNRLEAKGIRSHCDLAHTIIDGLHPWLL
jgi:hypothetical protein